MSFGKGSSAEAVQKYLVRVPSLKNLDLCDYKGTLDVLNTKLSSINLPSNNDYFPFLSISHLTDLTLIMFDTLNLFSVDLQVQLFCAITTTLTNLTALCISSDRGSGGRAHEQVLCHISNLKKLEKLSLKNEDSFQPEFLHSLTSLNLNLSLSFPI